MNEESKRFTLGEKIIAIVILTIIFISFIVMMMNTIITDLKYQYNLVNNVHIEIDDAGITNLLNTKNMILKLAFIGIPIVGSSLFLYFYFDEKKKANNPDKQSNGKKYYPSHKYICLVSCIMCLFGAIFMGFLLHINTNRNKDWTISINKIETKLVLNRRHYIILKGSDKRILVKKVDYYSYLMENDEVYVIKNKQNDVIQILSPKYYKYTGNKLSKFPQEVKSGNNEITNRYFYDIIRCIILIIIDVVIYIVILIRMIIKAKK